MVSTRNTGEASREGLGCAGGNGRPDSAFSCHPRVARGVLKSRRFRHAGFLIPNTPGVRPATKDVNRFVFILVKIHSAL